MEVKVPLVYERGNARPRTSIYALIKLSGATPSQYLNSPIHTRFLAIMAPALIRLHNFKPGELSASTFTHETETMQIQSTLYSRSTNSSDGGENTIIFIVLGVGWSCSFIVLWLACSTMRSTRYGLCDRSCTPPHHRCTLRR